MFFQGGKDSLVAYFLAEQAGLLPKFLYVEDGVGEYNRSWRLRSIIAELRAPIQIGNKLDSLAVYIFFGFLYDLVGIVSIVIRDR